MPNHDIKQKTNHEASMKSFMKSPNLLFLAIIMGNAHVAYATEVDNFTDRNIPLKDSRELLNLKMQTDIDSLIEKTNSRFNCEDNFKKAKEYFYKSLNQKVGGTLWSRYELEVSKDPEIDKRTISRKHSIYNHLNLENGLALYIADFGSVVNIGNNLVGTDKLGHFLGIGKIYFNQMRNKHKTIEEVLRLGEKSEKTIFGSFTTGIFSYGDLVSNYEGLIFFQNLFSGKNPYILCKNGELSKLRGFDWLDYVNDAWDESINCSTYASKKIAQKVRKGIKENVSPEAKCPLVDLNPETIRRYSTLPFKILNH